jgi:hypothetical protein
VIVFVPVEEPDRVAVPRAQTRLRNEVDAVLRDIIVDNAFGLEIEVITVEGASDGRLRQVVAHLRGSGR